MIWLFKDQNGNEVEGTVHTACFPVPEMILNLQGHCALRRLRIISWEASSGRTYCPRHGDECKRECGDFRNVWIHCVVEVLSVMEKAPS